MSQGRFSNLEIHDGNQPERRVVSGGAVSSGEGTQHFVEHVRDANYYMKQADAFALDGEHDRALRAFAAALGENPLLVDAWVGQVRMLLALEEYPEARLWADKAIEKFPDNPQLLAVKSIALYRMGNQWEARGMSDVALQKKGEFELVWLCRGELMLADDRAAFKECFQHASRLSARGGETMMQIGGLYLRYGHYSQALAALTEASREIPKSAWVWYQLGRVQTELGDHGHARVSFGEAHKLNPRSETYSEASPRSGQGWLKRVFGWWT